MRPFIKKFIFNSSSSSSSNDEVEDILLFEAERLSLEMSRGSTSCERRLYIDRGSIEGHNRLFNDYFAENPVYPHDRFRRRFRMSRNLFLRIQAAVEAHDPYFRQKRNAAGKLGLSSLQKITASLRMLAYGVTADFMDEYVRIGESTAITSLKKFTRVIISIFGAEYLRSPNSNDIARLLAIGENRGFPGMLGSIDCMHWKWKNCPSAWKGMYTGHIHEPTLILEAVASYDLWIWHAFFGMPGALNDINVLDRSNVFSELTQGRAPAVDFYAIFVKTIPAPQNNKTKHFVRCQESARKDVERAFGVLQSRFVIVRGLARYLEPNTLNDIMIACVVLHNMIVEDERHLHPQLDNNTYEDIEEGLPTPTVTHDRTPEFQDFIDRHIGIRSRDVHSQLQSDLVEHLWNIHSLA
ncbi:putative nuclease HARBI1 [Tripterygium wilfordii]|uniref:putative nuclease HARBI1 n=1 Tax=Tripterygium wilfordii TaxID=458696 RepID=UPI0018F852E4|nr:putative nuclease HARBI1 [Tripterygium wilfordii]